MFLYFLLLMTRIMYFTNGMQKNKKKKPRHCHIIDSAESHDIGGKREESLFYKDRI